MRGWGRRTPSVKESARCRDALDFKLDFDAEVLSVGEDVRAATGLVFAFFFSALAVISPLPPCQDCRLTFGGSVNDEDVPTVAGFGSDFRALGFRLVFGFSVTLVVDSMALR